MSSNSKPTPADSQHLTPFVLASASPSRRGLLEQARLVFSVQVSAVDEDAVTASLGPVSSPELALALARAKCEDVAGHVTRGLVLGCDSVFEFDGQSLGKPQDAADALERWRRMRGRDGRLHTGHWLIDVETGQATGLAVSTVVKFSDVADDEIRDYVVTGEPLQVAGAFTLEGRAGLFIDGIDGDPSNVIGLSLPGLRRMLEELGHSVLELTERPGGHNDFGGTIT